MKPRTSRLAVLSAIIALVVPIACMAAAGVVGLLSGIPLLGLVLMLAFIPAFSLIALIFSSVTFGLGAAAAARIKSTPGLSGIGFAVFARSVAGINIAVCLFLLACYIAIPTAAIYSESEAWRQTTNGAVKSMDESANLLANAAHELNESVATLPTISGQAQSIVSDLRAETDSLNAAITAARSDTTTGKNPFLAVLGHIFPSLSGSPTSTASTP